MTEQSLLDMKNACHGASEYVLRQPCATNRCKWLRKHVASLLSNPRFIEDYATRYEQEYAYADVSNPYLAEVLKNYDTEQS